MDSPDLCSEFEFNKSKIIKSKIVKSLNRNVMKKIIKREVIKTTTLSATMSVCEMKESGTNYVQVLPDEPCAGRVEPFRGLGYGQLLSSGTFEFTRHSLPRSQAETLLRLPHCTVSKCKDKTHRVTFIVRDGELRNFCLYLMEEIPQVLSFMYEYVEKTNGLREETTYRRKAA